MDWIDANQLGRRNLSPDAFKLLLGRRYNRSKQSKGGDRKSVQYTESKDQIDPLIKQQEPPSPKPATTAQTLAKAHGVGEATVKRAAKFAADVAKNPRLSIKGWGVSSTHPLVSPRACTACLFSQAGIILGRIAKRNTERPMPVGGQPHPFDDGLHGG